MRQVEAAATGEQEFACGVRHAVMDDDGDARLREQFGRGETGRAGANDDRAFSRKRRLSRK